MIYQKSPSHMSWHDADSFCKASGTALITREAAMSPGAREYVQENSQGIKGFWLESDSSDCEVLLVRDASVRSANCRERTGYYALCQTLVLSATVYTTSRLSEVPEWEYIYSCQCPQGFGYANCLEVAEVPSGQQDPGLNHCQVQDKEVTLPAPDSLGLTEGHVLFIDHAMFGRPFFQKGAFSRDQSEYAICLEAFYAQGISDYCVSSNTLAAVTYWCQGKQSCSFDLGLLLEAAEHKEYFIVNPADRGLDGAARGCGDKGGSLAYPTSRDQLDKVLEQVKKYLYVSQIL